MPKRAAKTAKNTAAAAAPKSAGFAALALHITDVADAKIFAALRDERPNTATFSLPESQPENLDPESAAKRLLEHALASDALPALSAPTVAGTQSDFKSLGVETVPLTGTTVVKFRQQVRGIPIYGSLISVELEAHNDLVSLNANLATPDVKSYVATVSPRDALKRIASEAGYGRDLPDVTPTLNLFFDSKGKWHLAYIAESVRSRKRGKGTNKVKGGALSFDYVIDAITGTLVAEMPRTPTADGATDQAHDELGVLQTFSIDVTGATRVLRDAALNIETYDFAFRDPEVVAPSLPGTPVGPPWPSAAVSAHMNAVAVTSYLRDVLKRNNIDNKGGRIVSSINCVLASDEDPKGSRCWLNAFWNGKQMIYGQSMFDDRLRSLASSLDIVAHELFHGVTAATARLIYQDETGALNESYSDIFGVLISNHGQPDIGQWNWQIGDALSTGVTAFRDMAEPPQFGQPQVMKDFKTSPVTLAGDFGGVHINCGIHNHAAYQVMTTRASDGFLFKPAELAAIFYVALTQQLTRQSTFSDSRRGVVLAARSLFRKLPQAEIDVRANAVEVGFDAAGIG